MNCPYFLCHLDVAVGASGVVNHQYERFVTCPGTGYVPTRPKAEQERLMAERAVATKLPRGLNG